MNAYEDAYQQAKRADPQTSYAVVCANIMLDRIRSGGAHATLGENLHQEADWRTSGLQTFRRLYKFRKLTPESRVIEYGCGSLRVGYHFINFLNPGNFTGMDVVDGFINIGKGLMGPDFLAQKQPVLSVISPASVEAAAAFGADFVFLAGVALHVHPDEQETFYANLRKITAKPGCKLVFSAHIADSDFEHTPANWAHPLDYYTSRLQGLKFVSESSSTTRYSPHGPYKVGYLEFDRPT